MEEADICKSNFYSSQTITTVIIEGPHTITEWIRRD